MTLRSLLVLAPLGALLVAPRDAAAQQAPLTLYDTTGTAWVYASYFKIPWPRVDSMLKLGKHFPAWRARAIQMGCFVDWQQLIHQTGNEYNVVRMTTFRSFRHIGPGSEVEGCTTRAWNATMPDSAMRAAIAAGNRWVFGDAAHYDVIYWVPYHTRR